MKFLINNFEAHVARAWALSESDKIMNASIQFQELLHDPEFQTALIAQFSTMCGGSVELLRSKEHGFILSAYAERGNTYRSPHNHGNGWVIYGVIGGQMKMGLYQEAPKLKKIDELILNSKDFKVYLPGDIHDTTGLAQRSIVLRFTSCDLKKEEAEGRMKKFESPTGLMP